MKKFLNGFKYAFNGIISAIKTQRNFRIHICVLIFVLSYSFFYKFNRIEYILLIITFSIVLSSELINTALEYTVNICSPEYNKLAKIAKDCAAGAVLITALGAIVIGIILFADFNVFRSIINYYCRNFLAFSGLILYVVASYFFIAYPSKHDERENNGNKN